MGIAALAATGCEDDGPAAPWSDPVTGAGAGGGLGTATGEGSADTNKEPQPEPQPCVLNCCDGTVLSMASAFVDDLLCQQSAISTGACDVHGGVANVFWGEAAVMQSLSCAGNCQVNCCDGTTAFSSHPDEQACEMGAIDACSEQSGGPSQVAFDHVLSWTALNDCPSVRPCVLRCGDGTESTTPHYQASLCVYASVESTFCEGHGGPKVVSFGGAQVWP
jgi:hypothetical protein